MNWMQILSQVPKGYNDTKDSLMDRSLKQQTFDTNNRQAPLNDEYLRAQIAHLRQPNQANIARNDQQQSDALLWKLLQSNQTTPMPQPPGQQPQGPSPQPGGGQPNPFQGASSPQPGPSPAGPGAGVSLPQGFQASPGGGGGVPAMPLPQSAQSMPGQPPQGPQPQPGPIQGAGPVPQPPQQPQDPIQMLEQKKQQAMTILQALPGTDARRGQVMQAYIEMSNKQQEIQRRMIDEQRRQQHDANMEANQLRSDQRIREIAAQNSQDRNRGIMSREDQGEQNRGQKERFHDDLSENRSANRDEKVREFDTREGRLGSQFGASQKEKAREFDTKETRLDENRDERERQFDTKEKRLSGQFDKNQTRLDKAGEEKKEYQTYESRNRNYRTELSGISKNPMMSQEDKDAAAERAAQKYGIGPHKATYEAVQGLSTADRTKLRAVGEQLMKDAAGGKGLFGSSAKQVDKIVLIGGQRWRVHGDGADPSSMQVTVADDE